MHGVTGNTPHGKMGGDKGDGPSCGLQESGKSIPHHAAAIFRCRSAEFIPSCNAGSGLTLSVRMLPRDVGKAVSMGWQCRSCGIEMAEEVERRTVPGFGLCWPPCLHPIHLPVYQSGFVSLALCQSCACEQHMAMYLDWCSWLYARWL